ncbi:MAG TPA: hypothetical protein VJ625_03535 [Propionibacteriaceae bacterium]|nr:hypothetical protein [Propionibacteriaceae bacterium]
MNIAILGTGAVGPALEGDLTAARGLEMYIPLWVRIFAQLGRPQLNIKLVRA